MISALLFLLAAGALVAYSFWVYLRAEMPVRSGRRLAVVRSVALLVILALVFDVHLPWGGASATRPKWALLDASLSMSAGDGAAWDAALRRARELEADGWSVVTFGAYIGTPGEVDAAPSALSTTLAPALARAAEAGAGQVRVLSDLRFEDPVEVAAALAARSTQVAFERFGEGIVDVGVAGFTVSDEARRGDPVDAELELFGEGVTDSISIEVREEGRLVLVRSAAAPAPGLRARVPLRLPAPQGEGRLRYSVRVHVPGDGFATDDEGIAYMTAGHEEGGLVVVSLTPDWEPRALLAVLAEATGLDATGYLRVGPDRFAPMGRALQRGEPVDSARVSSAAADAALLVVHGSSGATDAWGRALARRNGRVLLWPADARAADDLGVSVGPARAGEWYAAPGTAASPLATDLAGADLRDLPPLTSLLPLAGPAPTAPLLLQLGGTGPGQPALVLDRSDGRRRAVVLAQGFWRWAARQGAGRDAYRRLWSGVGGWLLAQDPTTLTQETRPERWVVARGAPVRWHVRGEADDSVRLTVEDSTGVVADTLLSGGGLRSTGPLEPGTYRYRATSAGGASTEGRFDVEARISELLPQPTEPEPAGAARTASLLGDGGRSPLRTSPWPYLLVLALLCAEWIGRRRAGLR